MTKNEIADVLSEIGMLLELSGENPFKIRAYQSGARALAAMEEAKRTINDVEFFSVLPWLVRMQLY